MIQEEKMRKTINKRKSSLINIIFILIIFFLNFKLALNQREKILYIKAKDIINEIRIIDASNDDKRDFNKTVFSKIIFKKKIETQYKEILMINFLNDSSHTKSSIKLQKENIFYDLNDSNLTTLFNKENICNEDISIFINDTFIDDILYCYFNNNSTNETKINSSIKDNSYSNGICYECNKNNNKIYLLCDYTKGYYFKENDNSKICYNNNTIENGYYLDINDKLYKKCNNRCLTCNKAGDDSNSNCLTCIKDYHFSPNKNNHCISFNELPNDLGYYLDITINKYIKCHEKCKTCNGPNENNCISYNNQTHYFNKKYIRKLECGQGKYDSGGGVCKDCDSSCKKCNDGHQCTECKSSSYHFREDKPFCHTGLENDGYYLDGNMYKKCHISCKTCSHSASTGFRCKTCSDEYYFVDNSNINICWNLNEMKNNPGYYFDGTMIKRCYPDCYTCTQGGTSTQMNCESCQAPFYFESTTSQNCVVRPPTGFYIAKHNEHDTLFPCYKTCLTCEGGGNDNYHNCDSCNGTLYFDDEIVKNCVDDDPECEPNCAKCYKSTDANYTSRSPKERCKRCRFKEAYYRSEKHSVDQSYVSCYLNTSSPNHYFYDETEEIHKICYRTCEKCFTVGDYSNHSCIVCDTNYFMTEERRNNCYPICQYNYYFNYDGHFKCTDDVNCPDNYYLIKNKTKCVANCFKDKDYPYSFKKECVEKCPKGTTAKRITENDVDTMKCIDTSGSEDECILDAKTNSLLDYEITEKVLEKYALYYLDKYPFDDNYVLSYTSPDNSPNQYLILLFKIERCPKEKIEKYIPIGLDECINRTRESYHLDKNLIVEIVYIYRKSSAPRFLYYLYHPINGKKLSLTSCAGYSITFSLPLFINKDVDEESVRYFADLNINIFDENERFFTDLCFPFTKDGKDITLKDRVELFYQNVSLCEEGCFTKEIDFEIFEVECSCTIRVTEEKQNINNDIDIGIANKFLNNSLSGGFFSVLVNSNIGVVKCTKEAFNPELLLNNYGGLMMAAFYVIQIFSLLSFICYHSNVLRNHIYSLANKYDNFPPKKTKSTEPSNDAKINDSDLPKNNRKNTTQANNQENGKDKPIYVKTKPSFDVNKEKKEKLMLNEKKSLFNNNNNKIKKFDEKDKRKNILNKKDYIVNNSSQENIGYSSQRLKLNDNKISLETVNMKQLKDEKEQKRQIRKKEIDNYLNNELLNKNKKSEFNQFFSLLAQKKAVEELNKEVKLEIKFEIKEKKKRKKLGANPYKNKVFTTNELDKLDFDEVIIYDKRSLCKIFIDILKKKQTLINTFCVNDSFKPFSIKLLVLIFSISCYFVINGFLYNEDYISNKFKNEQNKDISDYLSDSITRIIYSSIIGGLISFIVGMAFNIENKIEDAIDKFEKNKVLLRGEISKIYKCNKMTMFFFFVIEFILMSFFTVYIFCFCYVYPNNVSDWINSSLLVIGIMQLFSVLASFLISVVRYSAIKRQSELCFTFNKYLEDNL